MQALMQGKRGLIMGVANDHSIAWGIAKTLAAHGAELAFTYQGEALGKRVRPLAQSVKSDMVLPCDVEDIASVDAVFEQLRAKWGTLDFLVHAIGFSDRNELKGRYADTSRQNFSRTMVISCFSFTEVAKRAAEMMPESGGSLLTLTYGGSQRVIAELQCDGACEGRARSVREVSCERLWPARHPRQRDQRRSGANARGRGHLRCALHVLVPEAAYAASPHGDDRGGRRLGAVSAVGPVDRRHRRHPLCRFRLQHHLDAARRRAEADRRGRKRLSRTRRRRAPPSNPARSLYPLAIAVARWNAGRASQRSM